MKLHQLFLINNDCYKSNAKIKPSGIMVHSTGAANPWLNRYVAPDDGLLGANRYGNHWNVARPDGKKICPHAFIGKLSDGSIATYQVLPWDIRGWHSGSGKNGSANERGYIGFEICEDNLSDAAYFNKVYREAVELCAYLCEKFDISASSIIDHSEGYARGIASNHGDVAHWFPKFWKNMNSFRADVADEIQMKRKEDESAAVAKAAKQSSAKPKSEIAQDNTPHDWARAAVEWGIAERLMIGDDNGDLMLDSPITREQFITVLHRYDSRLSEKLHD